MNQIELSFTWPNAAAKLANSSSGAPIKPVVGIHRGTNLDLYRTVPNKNAFMAANRLGPKSNVQLRTATRECAVACNVAGLRLLDAGAM